MDSIVRILIVDDHPLALLGMREILKEEPLFNIVGEAKTGNEAINQTEKHMPDLILMDIQLPDINGMEATRIIKEEYPYVKIVMVTVSDDIINLFESIKNGAQGYLLKNVEHESWITYLKAVVSDNAPIAKPLAEKMLLEFSNHHTEDKPKKDVLSKREREILRQVAEGFTNREIANQLDISEHTVKNHLKNLFQKLHLNNRVQLAKYAYVQGYLNYNKGFSK